MKILIDCRAFAGTGTSASVYLFNLTNNLIRNKNYQFVLVLNNKKYIKPFKDHVNVDIVYSGIQNNILWDNLVIPYYSIIKKTDLIFYTKSSSCWYKISKKKIVTTIHGMIYGVHPEYFTSTEKVYWRLVGKISSIVADKIIVVSNSDKKDLVTYNYDPNQISIIPIGISDLFFSKENYESERILNKYYLKKNTYFVQVGHITEKKNQKFTISLFFEIVKNNPQYKLIFIGNPNYNSKYYSEIMHDISRLGIEENIIFLGVIDQNSHPGTIPALLNKSVCALFPSVYEGFGIPAIEAIAAGTPVLASDRGSLPEVLGKDNVIPLEEKEKWLRELHNLIELITYRDCLISKQRVIIEKYRWGNIAKEYLRLFNSLLEV